MGWYEFRSKDETYSLLEYFATADPTLADQIVEAREVDSDFGRVLYAAVRHPKLSTNVGALVCLIEQMEDGSWFYKPMDEEMGPVAAECPVEVLRVLSPTDNELALEWRARCRERLAGSL